VTIEMKATEQLFSMVLVVLFSLSKSLFHEAFRRFKGNESHFTDLR